MNKLFKRITIITFLSIIFLGKTFTGTAHQVLDQEQLLKINKTIENINGIIHTPSDIVLLNNGKKGYVSSLSDGVVLIIDFSADEAFVSGQIDNSSSSFKRINTLAINNDLNELYILDWELNKVFIVNTLTDELYPNNINVSPSPKNMIVSNEFIIVCSNTKDEITLIDSNTKNIEAVMQLNEDADPYGMAVYNKKLYVVGTWSNKIYIIDIEKESENYKKIIKTINLDSRSFDAVSIDGNPYLYISHDTPQGLISVIDTQSNTIVKKINLSQKEDIFINPKGMAIFEDILYITNFSDSSISLVDIKSNTLLNQKYLSYAKYGEKIKVSPDGNFLYITHCYDNSVEYIEIIKSDSCPSFEKGPDQSVKNCSGTQIVNNWAKDIKYINEDIDNINFIVTSNNNSLFKQIPQISKSGTLTYEPNEDVSGIAIVSVILNQNSNTNCNLSQNKEFIISVEKCGYNLCLLKDGRGEIVINNEINVLAPWQEPGWNKIFDKGENVSLYAKAFEQWEFAYWSGDILNDDSKNNPIIIQMDKDTKIYAHFIKKNPAILNISGNCIVKINDTINELPFQNVFQKDSSITLNAQGQFLEWLGDIKSNENPIIIKMDNDKNLTAICIDISNNEMILDKGWNLISIPFIPVNQSIKYYFPEMNAAYKYNNGAFIRTELIEPGIGYFIQMKESKTLSSQNWDFSLYKQKMSVGWHLIGSINKKVTPKTQPPNQIEVIYQYINGEYTAVSELLPNYGYWIKLLDECNLILDE